MKNGKTLQEMAVEIERQANSKRDFIAPVKQLSMVQEPAELKLKLNGQGNYAMTDTCHDQVAEKFQIPLPYYKRMRGEAPGLLATNVNHWLASGNGNKTMVRTLDGKARAFLSDRYRPLDNVDLAEAVLPIIMDHKWSIKSCELTERRLYLKIVSEQLTAKVETDHVNVRHGGRTHIVHPGIVISNSEIGLGAVNISPSLHWEHCLNLAIMDEASMAKSHVGRRDERFGDLATEFFRDETRLQDDRAFWMKVRDIVTATINEDIFLKMVERFQKATEQGIDGDPVKAVELTAKRFGLNENERVSVLKHLIQDGDLSAYGLSGAITRASQDVADYDRATELEKLGGRIIELPKQDWMLIASAN